MVHWLSQLHAFLLWAMTGPFKHMGFEILR